MAVWSKGSESAMEIVLAGLGSKGIRGARYREYGCDSSASIGATIRECREIGNLVVGGVLP